jgi:hypothetical protein
MGRADTSPVPVASRPATGVSSSAEAASGCRLIGPLDTLAARPGHQLIYSVGWDLSERERSAITAVPEQAWQIAVGHRGQARECRADDACPDHGCTHRKCWIEEAHVTELTGLLREGPAGD